MEPPRYREADHDEEGEVKMKKGELVVRVLSGAGFKTATIGEVESVKRGIIKIVDSSLEWGEESCREINPAIPGFFSYLVTLDGGEEERIRHGVGPKKARKP